MVSGEGPAPLDAAAADLITLEKQFAQAIVKADVDALDNIVSDDWIIIGPEGKVINRPGFLDVVRSGALAHSSMESDETRVRVYGDTAIVTARVVTAGAYQGQAFTTHERSSDVFVRQQGHWKCVLTQLTPLCQQCVRQVAFGV
jgi:ketosteroid isomerase-like protein